MGLGKQLRVVVLGLGFAVALGGLPAHGFAAPAAAPAPASAPAPDAALARMERIKSALDSMALSADVKAKLDPMFVTAKKDVAEAEKTPDETERKKKVGDIMGKLAKDMGALLSGEQRTELNEKLEEAKFRFQIEDRKRKIHNPAVKLTPDQAKKVDAIFADTLKKLDDVIEEAHKTKTDSKPKEKEIATAMLEQLQQVLKPEQVDAFKTVK